MRIRIQVLVGLKEFITSHIGDEQVPLVEHADETRLAALREASQCPASPLVAIIMNGAWRMKSWT